MTNKPMLSVEREHRLKIHRKPFLDLESGAKTCEIRDCSDRDFQVGDSVLLMLVDETGNPTPNELRRKITHIQTGYGLQDHLCVLSYEPAAQHQGEPVAIERFNIQMLKGGFFRYDSDSDGALVRYQDHAEQVESLRLEVARLNRVKLALAEKVTVHADNCAVYRAQLAEQPAPVAILLPERMVKTDRSSDEYDMCADAHNDCLDAVARLNGVKP